MIGASGIDWGHEAINSLYWCAKAFVITTLVSLAIMAAIIRFTNWGKQFWRISGGFFRGRQSLANWALLAVVLILAIVSVRMNVLLSYYSNDMYTSLQGAFGAIAQHDDAALDQAKHAFWNSIKLFCVLATIFVIQAQTAYFVNEAYQIRWRVWLNDRVAGDWLTGGAFYKSRFIDNTIDNPDQRVQQDVDEFVRGSFALAFGGAFGRYAVTSGGIIGASLTLVAFTNILWNLSGPLHLFGFDIPRALVLGTLVYVIFGTVIAFWIGRPLIRLNFWNERLTANFRYALIRLRDGAENVAFYRGEKVERAAIFGRFGAIISNYWSIVFRQLKFYTWNLVVSQISAVFSILVQAPRLFAGQITLGDLQQSATAFSNVQDSLSFFRNNYDAFTYYRATLIRLDGMVDADEKARELPELDSRSSEDGLEVEKVRVTRPDGYVLIDDLNFSLEAGQALVVKGQSGVGKTTLLRALARLWPYTTGTAAYPSGTDTMFLSQMPYLPLGDLQTAVAYPATPDQFDEGQFRAVLDKVALGHLSDRLTEEQDWVKILSPGEQQRIAFARVLLIKPKVVFMDEATSAVDEGLEYTLYRLVRTDVPECIVVSVAHRSTVDQHHTQRLDLSGTGPWELAPVS